MAQNFVKDLDQVYQHPKGVLEKVLKLVKEVASNVDQDILNNSLSELVADIDNTVDLMRRTNASLEEKERLIRNCEMEKLHLTRKFNKTSAKCDMLSLFGTIKSMISEYYNNPSLASLDNHPILKMKKCFEVLRKTLDSLNFITYREEIYGAPIISPTRDLSPATRRSNDTNNPLSIDSPVEVAASDKIDPASPDHFSQFNIKKMPDNFTDEFPLKRFALSEKNIEKAVVERLFGNDTMVMNTFLAYFIEVLDDVRRAVGWYKTEIGGLNVDEVTIVQPIVYGFQRLLMESYLRQFGTEYGFTMDPCDLRNINSVHLEAKFPLQDGKPPMEYAGNGDMGFAHEYEKRWPSNPDRMRLSEVLYEIKTCFKNLQPKNARAVAEQCQLVITMFSVLNEFLRYQKDAMNSSSAGSLSCASAVVAREPTEGNAFEPATTAMPSSSPPQHVTCRPTTYRSTRGGGGGGGK